LINIKNIEGMHFSMIKKKTRYIFITDKYEKQNHGIKYLSVMDKTYEINIFL